MLLEGVSQEVPWTSQDFSINWDYRSVAVTEGEVPGTSQEFQDLELQECSYVTRGGIPGNPMDIPGLW